MAGYFFVFSLKKTYQNLVVTKILLFYIVTLNKTVLFINHCYIKYTFPGDCQIFYVKNVLKIKMQMLNHF